VDNKFIVTEKGVSLKKSLLEKRKSKKENEYISVYNKIFNGSMELPTYYNQFLSEFEDKKCAAIIISDIISGIKGNLRQKQKICPDYKVYEPKALHLFRQLQVKNELEEFKKANISKYQVRVLINKNTCSECEKMDKKIFEIGEAVLGVNCPPFHEGCRCDVLPMSQSMQDLIEREKRAMDSIKKHIPKGVTFDEYIDGLEPTSDGKLEYVNHSKPKKYNHTKDTNTKNFQSRNTSTKKINAEMILGIGVGSIMLIYCLSVQAYFGVFFGIGLIIYGISRRNN